MNPTQALPIAALLWAACQDRCPVSEGEDPSALSSLRTCERDDDCIRVRACCSSGPIYVASTDGQEGAMTRKFSRCCPDDDKVLVKCIGDATGEPGTSSCVDGLCSFAEDGHWVEVLE